MTWSSGAVSSMVASSTSPSPISATSAASPAYAWRWAAEARYPGAPLGQPIHGNHFTLHVAAIQNGAYFEFSIERTPWTDGLYTPARCATAVAVPDGPGWVEITKWLAAADRRVSELS